MVKSKIQRTAPAAGREPQEQRLSLPVGLNQQNSGESFPRPPHLPRGVSVLCSRMAWGTAGCRLFLALSPLVMKGGWEGAVTWESSLTVTDGVKHLLCSPGTIPITLHPTAPPAPPPQPLPHSKPLLRFDFCLFVFPLLPLLPDLTSTAFAGY